MRWKVTLCVSHREVKLLVTDEDGQEYLRARFPYHPEHPRALLTLLEGLALWSGAPLTAVISVTETVRLSCDSSLFGGVVWPADSALVHVEYLDTVRPRRLRGLGSFREVLRAHSAGRGR